MEIEVRARNVGWNEEWQKEVERRIESAVDRHSSRIDRISVYLADVNGPRGGVDKLCQITANVRGIRPVRILGIDGNLLAAVYRSVRRLGYRIGRSIDRSRVSAARGRRATIRVV